MFQYFVMKWVQYNECHLLKLMNVNTQNIFFILLSIIISLICQEITHYLCKSDRHPDRRQKMEISYWKQVYLWLQQFVFIIFKYLLLRLSFAKLFYSTINKIYTSQLVSIQQLIRIYVKNQIKSRFHIELYKTNNSQQKKTSMQGPLNLKNKLQSSPLVSIYKASTPIINRVMSNNLPANSTPININKLQSKSPGLNKQNNNFGNFNSVNNLKNTNCISQKRSFKNDSVQKIESQFINLEKFKSTPHNDSFQRTFQKSTANLSPIMALNRKLSEGPFKMNNFRSLTPNVAKCKDNFQDNSYQDIEKNQYPEQVDMPNDKKNIKFAMNSLRSSNSFTNLFQSRNKTPTRLGSLALNSLGKKSSIQSSLKSSIKQNNLALNMLYTKNLSQSNSKKSLIASKSFDKITPQSIVSPREDKSSINLGVNASMMMCNNNHGKKAKYRVKIQQESDDILAYCSKCAIQLVQKGFSVEQLNNDQNTNNNDENTQNYGSPKLNFRDSNSFKNKFNNFKSSYMQSQEGYKLGQALKIKFAQKKSSLQNQKQQFQSAFEKDCEDIECYYNSIINFVEEQRKKDKQRLIDQKNEHEKNYNVAPVLNNLDYVINQVTKLLKNRNMDTYSLKKEMKQIQSRNMGLLQFKYHLVEKFVYFREDMQEQFDNFAQNFCHYSLKFDTNKTKPNQYQIGKNNALRFSFQKALQNKKKRQFLQGNNMRILHQQEEEYEDNSNGQENIMNEMNIGSSNQSQQQPFRTLFPEDDQFYEQHINNQAYSPNFKVI